MDQPGLEPSVHQQALRGLERVNQLSRTAHILFQQLRPFWTTNSPRPLRLLDVATGGGDVALGVARLAANRGLPLEVSGCDLSPTAIEHATGLARRLQIAQARFFQHDILTGDLPEQYDVVMCTLFLHHLSESDTVTVLQRMSRAATQVVLVDDLCRTYIGYWLAWIGCRLLSRSPIVHVDGPLSVCGAYTINEIKELAEQAGLQQLKIWTHWPQRFLLMGRPTG